MQVVGRRDLFARCDGDEFVFFLYGKQAEQAQKNMKKLQTLLRENLIDSTKGTFEIRASVGVSCWRKGMSIKKLIQLAGIALHQAKSSGRNQIVLYDDKYNYEELGQTDI